MAKKDIELLEKRIELLEMKIDELKSIEPDIIEQRFKSIEESLYSTKDILNMKDACQFLGFSQSMLYKLTCNGEIPHFKPRGKSIFFEKKELTMWIKNNGEHITRKTRKTTKSQTKQSSSNEKKDS
jgi:excisionase family DNA binding protein